jgi:DNA-binding transcriptional LysR family regulator
MTSSDLTLFSNAEGEMLQISEPGVQKGEHTSLSILLDKVNWHDLNMMGQIAEARSFRKASLRLGVAVNTVRTRLGRLEKAMGTVLFARSRKGLQITQEGRAVLRVLRDMRTLGTCLPEGRGNHILAKDGEVRVCASEGVGTFWLTPRLPLLKQNLPEYVVALECSPNQSRVTLDGYDVAVGFKKPDDLEAVCAKIATLHFMLFASDEYLREHGVPASFDDVAGHVFVQQESPGMVPESIRHYLGEAALQKLLAFKFNSSFSHYWAVVSGIGIAAMPTYARIITRRVRPIDIPFQMRFELWMSYRREARNSEPVRKVVDWLRKSFDPVLYPWFADHFVHPNAFTDGYGDGLVIPLFDQMTGAY